MVYRFELGRQYKHIPTGKVYTYLHDDSDRPHPDIVVYDQLDPDIDRRENKRYTMNPDEFRELDTIEHVDYEVLQKLYASVENSIEIPLEILDAEKKVSDWFMDNDVSYWVLGGSCSLATQQRLERMKKFLGVLVREFVGVDVDDFIVSGMSDDEIVTELIAQKKRRIQRDDNI